jgi:hypothetical protein
MVTIAAQIQVEQAVSFSSVLVLPILK